MHARITASNHGPMRQNRAHTPTQLGCGQVLARRHLVSDSHLCRGFQIALLPINGFEGRTVSILNRDKVNLMKQDGSRADGISATVAGSDLIVIKGGKHIIDVGDLLTRKLSNGAEETYQVIDPKYYERTPGASGPHYQLKVKKLGVPEASAAAQNIVYNVSGNNARVNVGSVDNSTTITNINEVVGEQLETLRKEIANLNLSPTAQTEALEVLDTVEEQFTQGKPKRSIVMALLDSLPKIATVAVAVEKISALF